MRTGVAALTQAKVQIDPAPEVTTTATLSVNGSVRATATTVAAGDTYFNFPAVAVHAGDSVALTITFTATFGKIITVYEVGNPGGRLSVTDTCSDGAANVDTTSTGLRATVSGVS
ncbi:MAG: hypothetical protein ACJ74U_13780 [Jatrophihabitantaceae bacterium]